VRWHPRLQISTTNATTQRRTKRDAFGRVVQDWVVRKRVGGLVRERVSRLGSCEAGGELRLQVRERVSRLGSCEAGGTGAGGELRLQERVSRLGSCEAGGTGAGGELRLHERDAA
jgi:hypothetical protein